MKTVKVLSVLIAAAMLIGCSSFVGNAYKTMYLSAQAYDAGMKSVSDLQKQGQITADQREQINDVARKFWASYQIAAITLSAYNKSQTDANKESLVWALSEMASKWRVYVELVNTLAPGTINLEVE